MFIHEQTYADLIAELEQLRRTAELSGQINANLRDALAKSENDADDVRRQLYRAERDLEGERERAYRAERDLEGERARAARIQRSEEQIAGELYETCRQLEVATTAAADRKELKRELRRERKLFDQLRDDYHSLFYRATDESGERETWKACAEEREAELRELKGELREMGVQLAEREEDVRQLKKAARPVPEQPPAREEKDWGGSPKLNGLGWIDIRPVDRRKLSVGEKALIVAELRRRYVNDVFSVGKQVEVSTPGNNHLWLEVVSMGGLSRAGTPWTHTRLVPDVIVTVV